MQQYTTPRLATTDDPIRSRHDLKTTRQSIKDLLANGTPKWVSHPEDYKALAKESYLADKEQSDAMVREYRMQGQEILSDAKPRMVNIIQTREFIKKLRDNGIRCFTFQNGHPQQVGLWACRPNSVELTYVCFMQIPCMYEWSVLRLDRHGLPNGEDFRGWRTVLSQLVVKDIATETKLHKIFGRPTDAITSRRYRQTLFNFRNGIGRQHVDQF